MAVPATGQGLRQRGCGKRLGAENVKVQKTSTYKQRHGAENVSGAGAGRRR